MLILSMTPTEGGGSESEDLLGFVKIVVLQLPPLTLLVRVTLLHDGLVLGRINGQAFLRRAVSQLLCLLVERPVLVALRAVAWEQHHVPSGVVQASLIAAYLALLAQHPEL